MENSTSFDNFENKTMPKNNMAIAIVGTILGMCSPCCIGFILGIVAIVMAAQVKKKFNSGDHAGAEKSAKNARLLGLIAIAIAVIYLIYVGLNWEDTMEQYRLMMEQYGMESNF